MASRKVKWTLNAIKEKTAIYEYWIDRNKSTLYPEKLEILFDQAMELTTIFPYAGLPSEYEDIRIQLVRDYKLVYRISENSVEVISVWGGKQDPDNFKY